MDLKIYYKKIREAAESIPGDFAILASLETPDGGKPGVMSEVSKPVAARMIVEGRAQLASPEEVSRYREKEEQLRVKAEQEIAPARLQVALLSEKDIDALKAGRNSKPADKK
jgi:hypothetical protein